MTMKSHYIRVGVLMTGVLVRRQQFGHIHKTYEGEVPVKMKAETGFMLLQTEECQGLPATLGS